jgi:hypothetical protein
LQNQLSSKVNESQEKNRISQNLESQTSLLDRKMGDTQDNIVNCEHAIIEKTSELKRVDSEISSTEAKIRSIDHQIRELNNIIGAPRIAPEYSRTDGKCIYGHVNCRNRGVEVPGKTVIVNQSEIDAQKREIVDCIEKRTHLLSQKNELARELNRLRHKCVSLTSEIGTSQRQGAMDLDKHKAMQIQVHQATQAQVRVNSEYQSLIHERIKTQKQLAEVESEIQRLTQQQTVDNNSAWPRTMAAVDARSEAQTNSARPAMSSDRKPVPMTGGNSNPGAQNVESGWVEGMLGDKVINHDGEIVIEETENKIAETMGYKLRDEILKDAKQTKKAAAQSHVDMLRKTSGLTGDRRIKAERAGYNKLHMEEARIKAGTTQRIVNNIAYGAKVVSDPTGRGMGGAITDKLTDVTLNAIAQKSGEVIGKVAPVVGRAVGNVGGAALGAFFRVLRPHLHR